MALRPQQIKALMVLLEGGSITAAAGSVGVSRETMHKWLRSADFQEALRTSENEAMRMMSARLTANVDAAISKTVELMLDPQTPPSVQLRAADMILGRMLELRELTIVEDRLNALEAALALRGGG